MTLKSLLPLLLFFPTGAAAQQLHVECQDTALTNRAMIFDNHGIRPVTFSNGVLNYTDSTITELTEISLIGGQGLSLSAYIEPGKTLDVKVTKKDGNIKAAYKGPNAPMTEFHNAYSSFYAKKNWNYELMNPSPDTLTYEQAFEYNDNELKRLRKMAAKLPENQRDKANEDVTYRYLNNKLDLYLDRDSKYGKLPLDDKELQQFLGTIDPNDPKTFRHNMLQSYIAAKIPMTVNAGSDVTDYGVSFLETVSKYISNPEAKNSLDDYIIRGALGTDGLDVERFWKVAKANADTSVINRYQFVADSKMRTKAGTKCPDVAFNDEAGNAHQLSEYFGTVLYIDLWATWCGPCQMEIPYMAKAVEHYKDNPKIRFISISSDRNRDAWLKQINSEKPAWPQFNTDKQQDSILSKAFGVIAIPRFLIINADGTINNNDAFRPSDDSFYEKIDAIIAQQK